MNIAAQTIAEMLDQGRKFNRYYISLLDPKRIHESYTFDSLPMNSAFFIVGHLGWAEWALVTDSLKGPAFESPILEKFHIGSQKGSTPTDIAFPELVAEMDRVHNFTLEYIRGLSEEELAEEVYVAPARWNTTRKKGLYHMIRHESFHTGQLGWIAKLHGGRTP